MEDMDEPGESLGILYQDDFLVAVEKPAGMLVHPVSGTLDPDGSAMKRLRDQLGRRVYPVHRLDRPTSGVLLFALDKKSASTVQQAFEHRSVRKTYQAVVYGVAPEEWVCEVPLGAEAGGSLLAAKTLFRRLRVSEDHLPGRSLLEVVPETGRFHQIRRHLLHGGFPIVGDFRYAGRERSFELGEIFGTGSRMLLQARTLEFSHPKTGEWVRIEAPPDADLAKCIAVGDGA